MVTEPAHNGTASINQKAGQTHVTSVQQTAVVHPSQLLRTQQPVWDTPPMRGLTRNSAEFRRDSGPGTLTLRLRGVRPSPPATPARHTHLALPSQQHAMQRTELR